MHGLCFLSGRLTETESNSMMPHWLTILIDKQLADDCLWSQQERNGIENNFLEIGFSPSPFIYVFISNFIFIINSRWQTCLILLPPLVPPCQNIYTYMQRPLEMCDPERDTYKPLNPCHQSETSRFTELLASVLPFLLDPRCLNCQRANFMPANDWLIVSSQEFSCRKSGVGIWMGNLYVG